MKPTLFLPIALVLGACDMTPDFVSIEDVGGAMQLGRYNVVCKGLEMEDEETRGYAAGRLNGLELPQAQECVCKHGIDLEAGTFDPAILNGLGTTNRDEMVSCFLEGLDVPHMEKKLELVVALAQQTWTMKVLVVVLVVVVSMAKMVVQKQRVKEMLEVVVILILMLVVAVEVQAVQELLVRVVEK